MSAASQVVCRKPGCQSAQTGTCAEGHAPLASCPWFGKEGSLEPFLVDSGGGEEAGDFVVLSSGEPLTPQAVDDVVRSFPIRNVAIVGDRDSGKTTLICSIYQGFLRGQFREWRFAGSRTLVGFEERSHESRVASGRTAPDTAHTSLAEGLRFFHLRMESRSHSDARTVDLMLSDRAGEVFASVRDKPSTSNQLLEVVKAHRTLLLLDGSRFMNPETRGGALQSVRGLLRALIDGGALGASSVVQVVLTKNDLVVKSAEAASLDTAANTFFETLKRDFGARLKSLTFWRIAARDPLGQQNSGLIPLMREWLAEEEQTIRRAEIQEVGEGQFDRLLGRVDLKSIP